MATEAQAIVAPLAYSFSMVDLGVYDEDLTYTFMCQHKRFILSMSVKDLEGEGGLVGQFYDFKDNLDDLDVLSDFETWVVDAINDNINALVPAPSQYWKPTSLQDYYGAETFVFEMANIGGSLMGLPRPYDPVVYGNPSPRFVISDVTPEPSEDRNSLDHGRSKQNIIPRTDLPLLPLFEASQIVRDVGPDSIEEEMCEAPRTVRRLGTDQKYFFKAASELHGFRRELDVLIKIRNIANKDPSVRTTKIVGLVKYDGEDVILGMLMELIDGPTLHEKMYGDASIIDKQKWISQVEDTVQRLHAHGIVWGDVKPDNVIINTDGNAVVVDFGGGYTTQYIEPEWQETKRGDMQGLKKMRAKVLSVDKQ